MRSTWIGRALFTALLLLATYVMLADFANLSRAARLEAAISPEALPLPQPWGGMAWRELARLAVRGAAEDPDTARMMLQRQVRNYPVDPQPWLDLARLEARRVSDTPPVVDVQDLLSKALAARPYDRDALWSAAQIALRTGNPDLAEQKLRTWLKEFPTDTGRALFIAARWIPSPGDLLDRILPPGEDYLAEAMRVA
ncbi:MAG: tetratricopeptide repeat protein [Wenzhouxiangellaceae bacterium]